MTGRVWKMVPVRSGEGLAERTDFHLMGPNSRGTETSTVVSPGVVAWFEEKMRSMAPGDEDLMAEVALELLDKAPENTGKRTGKRRGGVWARVMDRARKVALFCREGREWWSARPHLR